MELQLDLLRTFLAIIDSGGFTNASKVVFRSQSAISLQVKRLEETIGQPLFKRGNRSFSLTATGEMLIPYARRMMLLHEETVAAIQKPEVAGSVRLGIIDEYASHYLPEILATFASTFPNVLVTVRCEPSVSLRPLLSKGELDLALITGGPDDKGEFIRNDPAVWVTSAKHNIHEQDPLPLAVFKTDNTVRKWPMEALDSINRRYRIAYESPSDTGMQAIVAAGLAVSFLLQSVVPQSLRILGPSEGFPELPVAKILLKKSPSATSKAVECMAQHIVDEMR